MKLILNELFSFLWTYSLLKLNYSVIFDSKNKSTKVLRRKFFYFNFVNFRNFNSIVFFFSYSVSRTFWFTNLQEIQSKPHLFDSIIVYFFSASPFNYKSHQAYKYFQSPPKKKEANIVAAKWKTLLYRMTVGHLQPKGETKFH